MSDFNSTPPSSHTNDELGAEGGFDLQAFLDLDPQQFGATQPVSDTLENPFAGTEWEQTGMAGAGAVAANPIVPVPLPAAPANPNEGTPGMVLDMTEQQVDEQYQMNGLDDAHIQAMVDCLSDTRQGMTGSPFVQARLDQPGGLLLIKKAILARTTPFLWNTTRFHLMRYHLSLMDMFNLIVPYGINAVGQHPNQPLPLLVLSDDTVLLPKERKDVAKDERDLIYKRAKRGSFNRRGDEDDDNPIVENDNVSAVGDDDDDDHLNTLYKMKLDGWKGHLEEDFLLSVGVSGCENQVRWVSVSGADPMVEKEHRQHWSLGDTLAITLTFERKKELKDLPLFIEAIYYAFPKHSDTTKPLIWSLTPTSEPSNTPQFVPDDSNDVKLFRVVREDDPHRSTELEEAGLKFVFSQGETNEPTNLKPLFQMDFPFLDGDI